MTLLSNLSHSELDLVLQSSDSVHYGKGSTIFSQGDPSEYFLIVMSGQVKVILHDQHGHERILTTLGRGSCVGEMSVLDGLPRSATIVTVEESVFRKVERETIHTLLAQNNALAKKIILYLSSHLRERLHQLKTNVLLDVQGMVILSLIEVGQREGVWENCRLIIEPKLSHGDLSRLSDCSYEAATTAIQSLSRSGYLTVTEHAYIIEERGLHLYVPFTL